MLNNKKKIAHVRVKVRVSGLAETKNMFTTPAKPGSRIEATGQISLPKKKFETTFFRWPPLSSLLANL